MENEIKTFLSSEKGKKMIEECMAEEAVSFKEAESIVFYMLLELNS